MCDLFDGFGLRVEIVEHFSADIAAVNMHAHRRCLRRINEIVNLFVGGEDVGDSAGLQDKRGAFPQFRLTRP